MRRDAAWKRAAVRELLAELARHFTVVTLREHAGAVAARPGVSALPASRLDGRRPGAGARGRVSGAALRIAVLTREGAAFGVRLLAALAEAGLAPVCLGIERVTWRARWRRARLLARKTSLANAAYHNARIWSRVLAERALGRAPAVDYARFCAARLVVTDINDGAMVRFVAEHAPDLVLLGQSGIVRAPLLALPRLGTLNAAPRLAADLPRRRRRPLGAAARRAGRRHAALGRPRRRHRRHRLAAAAGDRAGRRDRGRRAGGGRPRARHAGRGRGGAGPRRDAAAHAAAPRGGAAVLPDAAVGLPPAARRADARGRAGNAVGARARLLAGRAAAVRPGRAVRRSDCSRRSRLPLGASVLDFGCGGGQAAARLAERVGRLALWDPDPAARAAATAAACPAGRTPPCWRRRRSRRRRSTSCSSTACCSSCRERELPRCWHVSPRCSLPADGSSSRTWSPRGRGALERRARRGAVRRPRRGAGAARAAAARAAAGYLAASRRQPLTRIDAGRARRACRRGRAGAARAAGEPDALSRPSRRRADPRGAA